MTSDLLNGILDPSVLIIDPGNLLFGTSCLKVDQLSKFEFVLLRPSGLKVSDFLPIDPLAERVDVCFGEMTKYTKGSVKVKTDGGPVILHINESIIGPRSFRLSHCFSVLRNIYLWVEPIVNSS